MEKKTFNKQAAQGDLLIRRIDKLPATAQKKAMEDGKYILAHSETGHHHSIFGNAPSVVELFGSNDPLVGYLQVTGKSPVDLVHERAWDTHQTLSIDPGVYEIRRQRERSPEGWRRVED